MTSQSPVELERRSKQCIYRYVTGIALLLEIVTKQTTLDLTEPIYLRRTSAYHTYGDIYNGTNSRTSPTARPFVAPWLHSHEARNLRCQRSRLSIRQSIFPHLLRITVRRTRCTISRNCRRAKETDQLPHDARPRGNAHHEEDACVGLERTRISWHAERWSGSLVHEVEGLHGWNRLP